ncbi:MULTISPECIES: GNAT family N-acetyltransferase [Duganella]|jgi:GNAT superfamily N-acetyltransferase|uniref:GNAT family N-acetyltransferase n=1 Tax=Duganella TaxID=75654 RepID=UPI00159DF7D2
MHEDLQFVPLKSPLSPKALSAFRKDADWPDTPQPKAIDPRGKIVWVSVESNKKPIAIARLELAPPEFCYVADVIVSSKFRGRGVGHWFMQRIEQYCHGLGIRRLLLEAANGTESFYKSLAFMQDPFVPSMLKKDVNPLQRKMFLPPQGR